MDTTSAKKTEKQQNYPYYVCQPKKSWLPTEKKSKGQHVTSLPFPLLAPKAKQADTFNKFPTSLMSVGKTADDGTISIFTKDRVTVHDKKDVVITCKNKPLFIGVGNKHNVTSFH